MTQGLILFAHGARDPRWAAPFQDMAARIQRARPGVPLRLAFLEFMTPHLPQAAAELVADGCTRIDLLPLFLGSGGHVRKDLPRLMGDDSLECAWLARTAPSVSSPPRSGPPEIFVGVVLPGLGKP